MNPYSNSTTTACCEPNSLVVALLAATADSNVLIALRQDRCERKFTVAIQGSDFEKKQME